MTSGKHEANEAPEDTASQADAAALLEEAEAEAAAAEAVAAAAQARARAARLRRAALGLPEPDDDYGDDEDYDEDYQDYEDHDEEHDEEQEEDHDEEDQEDHDDVDGAEHGAGAVGWRRRLPEIAALAAIVLIVCFAGLIAYMVVEHRDTTRKHEREAAFVAGAKQGVVKMTSLDFSKANEDIQRVIESSTGQFKDDFQKGAGDFMATVIQSKAVTEGTVTGAALESITGDSAVVLVSATSRVTNSPPGDDVPPLVWRLRVTVANVDGQYKMSKVEYVP
ncbi:hypothetical protein [Mycobacterium sp.]|uniref:hypothetical protein n=1 Tax=Mycobacterium sp. TaxID=1785 RepID=UPI0025EBF616|nr:hypothetical protein [Mycobacterium sp.]MBW0015728.1 hypothetical protein [Mycobacterium sp.]